MVAKLRQADEALAKGTPLAEVARSLGVFAVTTHRWRTEYGAMDRDAIRRMKDLENENARLTRLLTDQQLDIKILKEIVKVEQQVQEAIAARLPQPLIADGLKAGD